MLWPACIRSLMPKICEELWPNCVHAQRQMYMSRLCVVMFCNVNLLDMHKSNFNSHLYTFILCGHSFILLLSYNITVWIWSVKKGESGTLTEASVCSYLLADLLALTLTYGHELWVLTQQMRHILLDARDENELPLKAVWAPPDRQGENLDLSGATPPH